MVKTALLSMGIVMILLSLSTYAYDAVDAGSTEDTRNALETITDNFRNQAQNLIFNPTYAAFVAVLFAFSSIAMALTGALRMFMTGQSPFEFLAESIGNLAAAMFFLLLFLPLVYGIKLLFDGFAGEVQMIITASAVGGPTDDILAPLHYIDSILGAIRPGPGIFDLLSAPLIIVAAVVINIAGVIIYAAVLFLVLIEEYGVFLMISSGFLFMGLLPWPITAGMAHKVMGIMLGFILTGYFGRFAVILICIIFSHYFDVPLFGTVPEVIEIEGAELTGMMQLFGWQVVCLIFIGLTGAIGVSVATGYQGQAVFTGAQGAVTSMITRLGRRK